MAKKHLEQYDKNGNLLDIYLNKDEVMVGNETLADKLDEMDAAIVEAAAQGGIKEETDPTVPSWAKQPTKPTYTAQEVGALPANTAIPTNTSDLNNNSGFVTETEMESAIDDAMDGLGGEVSVTTNEDGTFIINAGDDTYTIDLNHEHPQYAGYKTIESTTDATVTLSRDVIYDLGTVAGNKTISLPSTVDGAADYEFRLTYTSGTITLPSGVSVANDGTLTFTAGKIYQVVISGGILYYSETSASA